MGSPHRIAWGLLVCAALGYAADVISEEAAPDDGVLFPPNRAVLLTGQLDLICKTPQGPLKVEDRPQDWEPFQPPLHVAHLNLYPGLNRIQLGGKQREVFVARSAKNPKGPEGWEVYRNHRIEGQGAARCAGCHQTKQHGRRVAVGELKSYEACFECHKPVEFELIHSHPLEPLEPCQMCHALHGSQGKSLLKAPVKKLCAECHES